MIYSLYITFTLHIIHHTLTRLYYFLIPISTTTTPTVSNRNLFMEGDLSNNKNNYKICRYFMRCPPFVSRKDCITDKWRVRGESVNRTSSYKRIENYKDDKIGRGFAVNFNKDMC